MTTYRQISDDEWEKGDFRPCALIHRKLEELFIDFQVTFKEYVEDGLGNAKIAFFISSNNRQFYIRELTESSVPITEFCILCDPVTFRNDLNEILDLLNLTYSDLDYVYSWWQEKSN